MAEYVIEDIASLECLTQACQQLDRGEDLRNQIAKIGFIVKTNAGPKDCPLLKHEQAA